MNYAIEVEKDFGFTITQFRQAAANYEYASEWTAEDVWNAADNFRGMFGTHPRDEVELIEWCIDP